VRSRRIRPSDSGVFCLPGSAHETKNKARLGALFPRKRHRKVTSRRNSICLGGRSVGSTRDSNLNAPESDSGACGLKNSVQVEARQFGEPDLVRSALLSRKKPLHPIQGSRGRVTPTRTPVPQRRNGQAASLGQSAPWHARLGLERLQAFQHRLATFGPRGFAGKKACAGPSGVLSVRVVWSSLPKDARTAGSGSLEP
jgi:hypothetical protein